MPQPLIEVTPLTNWHNWHRTGGVGGAVMAYCKPRNAWTNAALDDDRWFEAGLAGLVSLVQRAQGEGRRVRAIGSGWSLSPVAYVKDYLVDTSALSEWSLGFSAPMVEAAFAALRERLVFAQCGVQVRTLNAFLEQNRLALPTQGASNGQTIAGAMSTGTHGSAHDVGSMADFMLGLHVVGEDGRHYWIERATRPVMTAAFCEWLGAEQVRDDELFSAAVVSFGSFGVVHAVLFAAEPVYVLDRLVRQLDYDQVRSAATTLELDGLDLPRAGAPFHFEVVINPYRRGTNQRGAFLRVLYKRTLRGGDPLPAALVDGDATIRSPDLVNAFSTVSDLVPALVPGLLQSQLESSLPVTAGALTTGLPGQVFDDTLPTNGGTSVEIGVPLRDLASVLDAIFAVTDKHTFGAPVALRYLRASDALLAFSCHAPTTCAIEMPGIASNAARAAHQLIFGALARASISATYHWGQQGPFTPESLLAGYGAERIRRWVTARQSFLKTPRARDMFANPMLDACGLAL